MRGDLCRLCMSKCLVDVKIWGIILGCVAGVFLDLNGRSKLELSKFQT